MTQKPLRWAEVSDDPDLPHFETLSAYMTSVGIPNEFKSVEITQDELGGRLDDIKREYQQIRLGGSLQTRILSHCVHWPSTMLTLQAADSFVQEGNQWWPRSFLAEAMQWVLAHDLKNVNFEGGVFMMGATCEARALIAALARAGFVHFSISDTDDDRAMTLVQDLKKVYFNLRIERVQKHLVTQLAGTHSVAVNSISLIDNTDILQELYYFNFLRPNGAWLDLNVLPLASPLSSEAQSLGMQVVDPLRVFAIWDSAWAKYAFGLDLQVEPLISFYKDHLKKYPSPELPGMQEASELEVDPDVPEA